MERMFLQTNKAVEILIPDKRSNETNVYYFSTTYCYVWCFDLSTKNRQQQTSGF